MHFKLERKQYMKKYLRLPVVAVRFSACTIIIIFFIAGIILTGCSGSVKPSSPKEKITGSPVGKLNVATIELKDDKLSTDQKNLISMVGYPNEFTIIFDEENNNMRLEAWIYKALQSSFIFKAGKFDSREKKILETEFLDDNYRIKPEDFSYGMSIAEVEEFIGEKGNEIIEPNTSLKTLVYGNGLIVCAFNSNNLLNGVARIKQASSGK
jgi:hypothetical protein